jgi:anthranilate/para-aminobenzoate synthase component I
MTKVDSEQLNLLPENSVLLPNLMGSPSDVAKSWDSNEPIIALIANGGDPKWARWSIIAPATGRRLTLGDSDTLIQLRERIESKNSVSLLPNWIGYIGYEFGLVTEPNIASIEKNEWPLIDLVWVDNALIHDNLTNKWWSVGDVKVPEIINKEDSLLTCSELHDSSGNSAFVSSVQKTIDYIHAGDIFQANITRRFNAEINGNIRNAALTLLGEHGGWFGAWIEFPDDGRFLLSMSPELFLKVNGESKEIVTRPMKGTRPEHDNPETLIGSEKDAAELHMIIDLMRNDLGRVCEFGSIEVSNSRKIERHPTVWQCVGEIHGLLRDEIDICDVLEATFPAGSITGAPKIRAMQIIDELEDSPRGPYCGAIGILGKSSMLSVGIRTALFSGNKDQTNFQGSMTYSTGCGIVADSDPQLELEESEVKTHIISPLINK